MKKYVRKKVEKEKRKEKMINELEKNSKEMAPENGGKIDLKTEKWVQNPANQNQNYYKSKNKDYIKDYLC